MVAGFYIILAKGGGKVKNAFHASLFAAVAVTDDTGAVYLRKGGGDEKIEHNSQHTLWQRIRDEAKACAAGIDDLMDQKDERGQIAEKYERPPAQKKI